MLTRVRSIVAGVAAGVMLASPLAAQLPIPRPAIVGGVSYYNLGESGVGTPTSPFGALRVDLPIVLFLAEGSLGVFRPEVDGERRTYLIPEVQAQWQLFPAIVRPYLGVGIGWLNPLSGSGRVATYSGSAGVRVGLPVLPIGFRAEARVRAGASNGLKRQATELTLGVSW